MQNMMRLWQLAHLYRYSALHCRPVASFSPLLPSFQALALGKSWEATAGHQMGTLPFWCFMLRPWPIGRAWQRIQHPGSCWPPLNSLPLVLPQLHICWILLTMTSIPNSSSVLQSDCPAKPLQLTSTGRFQAFHLFCWHLRQGLDIFFILRSCTSSVLSS